eukprot:CAMPEP_0198542122 /NCGR_PEP_ID=MMETSP1462-20131121/56362_1 /TAXON_ID=1333877 /ORGANISM="Brandtodinium nutriculum, Strain RCC3387" /LENGTH=58 /DNA_ID=CAMNT_0044272325 /DNA_START=29 /DNA_END=205 /DNA_ORIENTATION=-
MFDSPPASAGLEARWLAARAAPFSSRREGLATPLVGPAPISGRIASSAASGGAPGERG